MWQEFLKRGKGLFVVMLTLPLLYVPLAGAQEPAAESAVQRLEVVPDSVDELIPLALTQNPELLVARRQQALAEAHVKALELEVVQEVITFSESRVKLQEKIEAARQGLKDTELLAEMGRTDGVQLMTLKMQLSDLEQELAQATAQLRLHIGRGVQGMSMPASAPLSTEPESAPASNKTPKVSYLTRPEIPASLQEQLTIRTSLEFQEASLREVVGLLNAQYELAIVASPEVADRVVTIRIEDTPVKDALLAISDATREDTRDFVVFVVREYGILATTPPDAETVAGATIPGDIPLVAPPGAEELVKRSTRKLFARPEIPEQFAQALGQPIDVAAAGADTLQQLLMQIGEKAGLDFSFRGQVANYPPMVQLSGGTVRNWMEALADSAGCAFIFRDYGVLVADTSDATAIPGPALPADTPLYTDPNATAPS